MEARQLAEQFHLAEFLEEEMQARGWTLGDMVMNMGPFPSEKEWAITKLGWEMFFTVREVGIILSDGEAEQLGRAFNVNPQTFTNLHESWRKWKMQKEPAPQPGGKEEPRGAR